MGKIPASWFSQIFTKYNDVNEHGSKICISKYLLLLEAWFAYVWISEAQSVKYWLIHCTLVWAAAWSMCCRNWAFVWLQVPAPSVLLFPFSLRCIRGMFQDKSILSISISNPMPTMSSSKNCSGHVRVLSQQFIWKLIFPVSRWKWNIPQIHLRLD